MSFGTWRPFPFCSGVCTVMVAPMETAVTPTDDLMKERVTMSNVLKKIWCSSALWKWTNRSRFSKQKKDTCTTNFFIQQASGMGQVGRFTWIIMQGISWICARWPLTPSRCLHMFDRFVSSTFYLALVKVHLHISAVRAAATSTRYPTSPNLQDHWGPPQTSSDHLPDVFVTKVVETLLELQACPDGPFDGMTGESRKNLAKQLYKRTSEQWDSEVSDQYEAQEALILVYFYAWSWLYFFYFLILTIFFDPSTLTCWRDLRIHDMTCIYKASHIIRFTSTIPKTLFFNVQRIWGFILECSGTHVGWSSTKCHNAQKEIWAMRTLKVLRSWSWLLHQL